MNQALEKLLEYRVSKYAIAKHCCVSWNTVNLWSKGAFQPTKEHKQALTEMYLVIEAEKKDTK